MRHLSYITTECFAPLWFGPIRRYPLAVMLTGGQVIQQQNTRLAEQGEKLAELSRRLVESGILGEGRPAAPPLKRPAEFSVAGPAGKKHKLDSSGSSGAGE